MSSVPTVKVLETIRPDNAGTGESVLTYGDLSGTVGKYALTNVARWDTFINSEPDSLDELSAARQLASEYFLHTAVRLVDSHVGNRDLWASRFTEASIEQFGVPDKAAARQLVAEEYAGLLRLNNNESISQKHLEYLLKTYRSVLDASEGTPGVSVAQEGGHCEQSAVDAYGAEMRSIYQPLFDMVAQYDGKDLTPTDLHELFTSARNWLQINDDPLWGQWAVLFNDDTSLSVESGKRVINIASRREPVTPQEARSLIAHELLVHALRGKNGHRTNDRKLAAGLPGYLDAEEGLGVLAEEAINGKLPDKAGDRYVDIALALGTLDGIQRSRSDLFRVAYARQLIREQRAGVSANRQMTLSARVQGHIDRIYRGGPGDDLGSVQGVFTKDIAYYEGSRKMARYIAERLEEGMSIIEIFSFLSTGKFDPTNPDHLERLAQAQIKR